MSADFKNLSQEKKDSLFRKYILRDDREMAKLVLEAGANPCLDENMPMIWATNRGDTEFAKLLKERGASISFSRNWPIHRAIENDDKAFVEFLLQSGLNVDYEMIEFAYRYRRESLFELLIKNYSSR